MPCQFPVGQDSLGGNCKTTMVANIWPEAAWEGVPTWREAAKIMGFSHIRASVVHNPGFGQGKMLEETASTLRFATRMMKVPVGLKSPGT